jgi:hypothetical protein
VDVNPSQKPSAVSEKPDQPFSYPINACHIMLNKFAIDYIAFPHHHTRVFTHFTDDPIEAEDFLMHLLAARARITAIRHDSAAMTGPQFDQLLKVAAQRIAAALLQESLALDPAEIKGRFGFAA